MKYFIICLFVLFTLFAQNCYAQKSVYADTFWTNTIDKALQHIFNLDFETANGEIYLIEANFGKHPAVNLLKSQYIFWKHRPLKKGSEIYLEYENLLNGVIQMAEENFTDGHLEMEGNFYLMSGYSLLTEQYSEDKNYTQVLGTARNAYKYLKKGMGAEEELPDYYFSSGLYNYYRVKYPELHPFYKTFLWFFIDGDKDIGLAQLKEAANKSLFLKGMAYIYLFHLYLRYENDAGQSLPYAKFLAENYPNNFRFVTFYAESLIAGGNYDKAVPLAEILSAQNNILFKLPGLVFKGLIAENNNQAEEAKKHLNSCLAMVEGIEGEDEHFVSLVYAGLARVAIRENKISEARKYYEMAEKKEPYVPVKAEAANFYRLYP